MSTRVRRSGKPSLLLFGALVGTGLLLASAASVSAVEYRLYVASLYSESFAAFLQKGEYVDGMTGPGLDRLESSLDRGQIPAGALLYDRGVEAADPATSRAYRAARVRARVARGGALEGNWDEIRWEGNPGEHSVWVISPSTPRHQELYRTALKGTGPLAQFQPYVLRPNDVRIVVASFPLNFLWGFEAPGSLWDKHLSRSLDFQSGIAAVVGVNHNPLFADQVSLVLRHAAAPATYKAVLVWRRRPGVDRGNLEGPGNDTLR